MPTRKNKFSSHGKGPLAKFFDMRKEGKCVKRWWFNCKVRSLLIMPPPLSCYTLGLKVFVDIIECLYKEKLRRVKSHQLLYVPLLRTFIQSLYESAKKELSHLRICVT